MVAFGFMVSYTSRQFGLDPNMIRGALCADTRDVRCGTCHPLDPAPSCGGPLAYFPRIYKHSRRNFCILINKGQ